MRTPGWIVVAALTLGVGCGEEAPVEPEPVAEVVEEIAAIPEPTEAELPVAEDFAAEAQREITDDNYQAELDRIEAELAE